MKLEFVSNLSNVREGVNTAKRLEKNDAGVPGLGLIHGMRGYGKTQFLLWLAANNRYPYLRAKKDWTPSWVLEDLAVELQISPKTKKKDMFDDIVASLQEYSRLVIIDEVNVPSMACLETLRDLHDISGAPFIFAGHDGIVKRLKSLAALFDRFLYITEFKPLSLEDVKEFASRCMDFPVDEEALVRVLGLTQGNFRKTVVVMKGMENRARADRASKIGAQYLPKSN